MDIQWYPGHMTRAKRKIAEKIKIIDLIIEVVDARAPKSTINPDFEDMFRGKARITVLNKSDLADPETTKKWLDTFNTGDRRAIAFSCLNENPEKVLSLINRGAQPIVERYRAKGVNKTVRAMIAGVPNVGKSAILNRLVGKRQAKEGNKPGVTRGLQWIKLGQYLELMDTPGLMYPKIDDEDTAVKIAVLGSIREEILDIETLALRLIHMLSTLCPKAIPQRFGVEGTGEPIEVCEAICKRRGFLLKGAEYDYERCAKMLLDEFRAGKLGRISLDAP